MEPRGIELVTSCLLSTFADALPEGRKRRKYGESGLSNSSQDAPR